MGILSLRKWFGRRYKFGIYLRVDGVLVRFLVGSRIFLDVWNEEILIKIIDEIVGRVWRVKKVCWDIYGIVIFEF